MKPYSTETYQIFRKCTILRNVCVCVHNLYFIFNLERQVVANAQIDLYFQYYINLIRNATFFPFLYCSFFILLHYSTYVVFF